jgi:hypothetical protein
MWALLAGTEKRSLTIVLLAKTKLAGRFAALRDVHWSLEIFRSSPDDMASFVVHEKSGIG